METRERDSESPNKKQNQKIYVHFTMNDAKYVSAFGAKREQSDDKIVLSKYRYFSTTLPIKQNQRQQ